MAIGFPFSGDVLQSFPWKLFSRQMSQIGFINISEAKTPAPETEQSILEEVGSYGRQIGRIADALECSSARSTGRDWRSRNSAPSWRSASS
jgi:hypothetical protein